MHQTIEPGQLASIRKSIREIDEKRQDTDISARERNLLEISATTLREAERVAERVLRGEVIESLGDSVLKIQSQAKSIRAKVTRINKIPKALDHIEKIIEGAVTLFKGIAKW